MAHFVHLHVPMAIVILPLAYTHYQCNNNYGLRLLAPLSNHRPPLNCVTVVELNIFFVMICLLQVGLFTEIGPLSCFVSRHVS